MQYTEFMGNKYLYSSIRQEILPMYTANGHCNCSINAPYKWKWFEYSSSNFAEHVYVVHVATIIPLTPSYHNNFIPAFQEP